MAHVLKPIKIDAAIVLGDRLKVDWDKVDPQEFRRGLEVEQEHWNTVKGSWNMVAKIVLDHLAECGDYYSRLDEMETQCKRK